MKSILGENFDLEKEVEAAQDEQVEENAQKIEQATGEKFVDTVDWFNIYIKIDLNWNLKLYMVFSFSVFFLYWGLWGQPPH